jgi:hypothetical protein
MASDDCLRAIVERIRRIPEFAGCLIGYQGDNHSRILVYAENVTQNSANVAIVIEEFVSDEVALAELREFSKKAAGSPAGQSNPRLVTNRSRLGAELLGAGVSCGVSVVSAFGVVAGAAAEVPTGGASTFLVIASWTGLTSSQSCPGSAPLLPRT